MLAGKIAARKDRNDKVPLLGRGSALDPDLDPKQLARVDWMFHDVS